MATKIINFFDGYTSSSAPTQIGIQNLLIYIDDVSFENDNSGTPVLGNIYYNSTQNKIRYYANSWKSLTDEDDLLTVITNLNNLQTQSDNTDTNLSNLQSEVDSFVASKGQNNGLAPLDSNAKVPAINLPSYVDDVEEYNDLASFPVSGETGKIYVALDTNKTYRWSGSIYTEISPSDVNSVNGQTGIVNIDKNDVLLGNVTNDSQLKRESGDFNTFTEKVEPVKDDIVLIEDSEDTFSKKTVKLSNLLGSGQGGINYLQDNSDADNGIGDWLNLANGTIAINTIDPLSGDADFVLSQSSGTVGGIADCLFTIDKAGLVRKQYLSFDYDLSSISSLIEEYPIYVTITNSFGNIEYYSSIDRLNENKQGTFLTDFEIDPSVSTYKLNFQRKASTQVPSPPPAPAISFNIDNVRIAPREVTKSTGKTSWTAYVKGDLTTTLNEGNIVQSVTNPNTGNYKIYYNKSMFPNGAIFTPILKVLGEGSTSNERILRTVVEGEDGAGSFFEVQIFDTGASDTNIEGADQIQVTFTQKEEDQTAYQISTDLGNKEIVVEASGNAGQSVSIDNPIPFIASKDTVGAWDGSKFTAPVKGVYIYSGSIQYSSDASESIREFVDGVATKLISPVGTTTRKLFSGSVYLKQGQILDVRLQTTRTISNNPSTHYIRISKQGNDEPMLGVTAPQIAIFKDIKPNGTDGGSITAGSFVTRELNTHEGLKTFANLNSNQITLERGKYQISAISKTFAAGKTVITFHNTNTSTDEIVSMGDNGTRDNDGSNGTPTLEGFVEINETQTFELRIRVQFTKTGNGLGGASSFGTDEIYSTVKIQKIY